MDTDHITRTIHQQLKSLIMSLAENAVQAGMKPPFKLRIQIHDETLTELTVEHVNGDWGWDHTYAELVPLAANTNPRVELLIGDEGVLAMLDFSNIQDDNVVKDRVI